MGLLCYDESDKGEEIILSEGPRKKTDSSKSQFFRVINDPNHIIKYSVTGLNVDATVKMLGHFQLVKNSVTMTDLPTSLYKEDGKITGIVIPYYENGQSLYNISETHSLEELSKYFKHDDDELHNLFILLSNILDILEELKDNDILYTDSNMGNFIFKDNKVHLIDFEPPYVLHEQNKENIKKVLHWYDTLMFLLNRRFELIELCSYKPKDFEHMRKRLVKVENKVRKSMR